MGHTELLPLLLSFGVRMLVKARSLGRRAKLSDKYSEVRVGGSRRASVQWWSVVSNLAIDDTAKPLVHVGKRA